jgi:hypothetical protein
VAHGTVVQSVLLFLIPLALGVGPAGPQCNRGRAVRIKRMFLPGKSPQRSTRDQADNTEGDEDDQVPAVLRQGHFTMTLRRRHGQRRRQRSSPEAVVGAVHQDRTVSDSENLGNRTVSCSRLSVAVRCVPDACPAAVPGPTPDARAPAAGRAAGRRARGAWRAVRIGRIDATVLYPYRRYRRVGIPEGNIDNVPSVDCLWLPPVLPAPS